MCPEICSGLFCMTLLLTSQGSSHVVSLVQGGWVPWAKVFHTVPTIVSLPSHANSEYARHNKDKSFAICNTTKEIYRDHWWHQQWGYPKHGFYFLIKLFFFLVFCFFFQTRQAPFQAHSPSVWWPCHVSIDFYFHQIYLILITYACALTQLFYIPCLYHQSECSGELFGFLQLFIFSMFLYESASKLLYTFYKEANCALFINRKPKWRPRRSYS